jgi:2-polyprenyl-3-methyl-5-hydroxy-6-metoxy-1,4-benzoquinol methylase
MTSDKLYTEKKNSYYGFVRLNIIDLIPKSTKHLLDVGCGTGDTGIAAKQQLGLQEVVGIEFYEAAALVAQTKLDRVIVGDIESLKLDFPQGYFDCVVCADVLEHTKDPWHVLRTLRQLLQDEGVLIASIPNIRHIVPMLQIITDRFEYEESGILDKTHLRFFTLHTIRQMFNETGYLIQQVNTNRSIGWKFKLMNLFSLGLMRQFSIYQFIVVAKKK